MSDPSPITTPPDDKFTPTPITPLTDDEATGITPDPILKPPPVEAPLSPEGYRTAPDHTNTGWPPGVPFIVGNEACERFSFYGMRAILYVHLVSLYAAQLRNQEQAQGAATQTNHLFIAGVYALPMIGALIADRLVGKYRTIFYLSLVYCAGHAVLSLYENLLIGMYVGLGLIAVGSGGIKPCVSANVGDQFGKANWGRLRTIYQIFYFSINFGSFFATLLIPWVKDNAGALLIGWFPSVFGGFNPANLGTSIAFGIPGVLMFLATFVFWLGRDKFVHVPPRPGGRIGLLDTCSSVSLFMVVGHLFITPELLHQFPSIYNDPRLKWAVYAAISGVFLLLGLYLFVLRQKLAPDDGFLAVTLHVLGAHLARLLGRKPSLESEARPTEPTVIAADHALVKSRFWAPAVARFGLPATEGPVAVFKIISIFFLISVFWALFDQHSSTWIQQASEMNLGGLKPSQIPAANPLMVMVLIPLMNLVYALFDWMGLKATPLRRITVGVFIAASSFVACALLQQHIDSSPKNSVPVAWQLIQYLLITIAEVMVSITGLEFAYTQAPKKMKSTVMGFYLLTVTLGNVLVALLAGVQKEMTEWVGENIIRGLGVQATFFWIFATLSAVAGLIFGLRAYFYVPKDYAQE
jgi:POT family proton-dependent oligopeptide transporter